MGLHPPVRHRLRAFPGRIRSSSFVPSLPVSLVASIVLAGILTLVASIPTARAERAGPLSVGGGAVVYGQTCLTWHCPPQSGFGVTGVLDVPIERTLSFEAVLRARTHGEYWIYDDGTTTGRQGAAEALVGLRFGLVPGAGRVRIYVTRRIGLGPSWYEWTTRNYSTFQPWQKTGLDALLFVESELGVDISLGARASLRVAWWNTLSLDLSRWQGSDFYRVFFGGSVSVLVHPGARR